MVHGSVILGVRLSGLIASGIFKFQSKGQNSALSHVGRRVPVAFVLLGLAIPAYLYTSDF